MSAIVFRSAEEIAREMVTVERDLDRGTHYALIRDADVEICLEDCSTEAGARDSARTSEGGIARLIERSRAEGTAAAQSQQPRDLAGRIRALALKYADRWLAECPRLLREVSASDAYAPGNVVVDALRAAYLDALSGDDLSNGNRIRWMRGGPTCSSGTRAELNRAADELEAIARACVGGQQ